MKKKNMGRGEGSGGWLGQEVISSLRCYSILLNFQGAFVHMVNFECFSLDVQ